MTRTAALSAALVLALATGLGAHPNHGASAFDIEVIGTQPVASGTEVILRLTSAHEGGVTLAAVGSDIGEVSGLDLPLTITPQGDEILLPIVQHEGTTPGIFSLLLDFGADGAGPVLVIPEDPPLTQQISFQE